MPRVFILMLSVLALASCATLPKQEVLISASNADYTIIRQGCGFAGGLKNTSNQVLMTATGSIVGFDGEGNTIGQAYFSSSPTYPGAYSLLSVNGGAMGPAAGIAPGSLGLGCDRIKAIAIVSQATGASAPYKFPIDTQSAPTSSVANQSTTSPDAKASPTSGGIKADNKVGQTFWNNRKGRVTVVASMYEQPNETCHVNFGVGNFTDESLLIFFEYFAGKRQSDGSFNYAPMIGSVTTPGPNPKTTYQKTGSGYSYSASASVSCAELIQHIQWKPPSSDSGVKLAAKASGCARLTPSGNETAFDCYPVLLMTYRLNGQDFSSPFIRVAE